MHDPVLFSIITVCYNAADTILPTLQSVKSQTYTDYEHIIVDGASSDVTLKIITDNSYPQLNVESKPDKGLYYAMNDGLQKSKGRYVIFLNAGDAFASSDTLQAYADAAEQNPDIIYGDTLIVDSSRQVIGKRHLSAPAKLTHRSFLHGMLICHQAFMLRRSLAVPFDTSYRYSADYDWCVKAILSTTPDKCINLHKNTIHYLSEGVTTANHRASLKERFNIMTKHYGLSSTILAHLSFLPRALMRKLSK
jgi:glycosyltransferase involved in cell wall biosynthesis